MSLDRETLAKAVAEHGRVVRVVIAAHDGSSPRETGAAMLVWESGAGWGQSGTIGGGALEWEATRAARAMLDAGDRSSLRREALGPRLGQCCGGAVTLVSEIYDALALATLDGVVAHARPVAAEAGAMPLAIRRALAAARGQGQAPATRLVQGWLVEPLSRPERQLWIWGAGHVGRAIAAVLAPLPGIAITWVDTATDRFPAEMPAGVTPVVAENPAELVGHAPADAEHLILTYSHALDLELCHRLLNRGFARCGLIGSATKWARFQSRLKALGHPPARIATIACPIGDPTLGKHPQAIAIGVARETLAAGRAVPTGKERAG